MQCLQGVRLQCVMRCGCNSKSVLRYDKSYAVWMQQGTCYKGTSCVSRSYTDLAKLPIHLSPTHAVAPQQDYQFTSHQHMPLPPNKSMRARSVPSQHACNGVCDCSLLVTLISPIPSPKGTYVHCQKEKPPCAPPWKSTLPHRLAQARNILTTVIGISNPGTLDQRHIALPNTRAAANSPTERPQTAAPGVAPRYCALCRRYAQRQHRRPGQAENRTPAKEPRACMAGGRPPLAPAPAGSAGAPPMC